MRLGHAPGGGGATASWLARQWKLVQDEGVGEGRLWQLQMAVAIGLPDAVDAALIILA